MFANTPMISLLATFEWNASYLLLLFIQSEVVCGQLYLYLLHTANYYQHHDTTTTVTLAGPYVLKYKA